MHPLPPILWKDRTIIYYISFSQFYCNGNIAFFYNYLALWKIFFTILRIRVLIAKRNLQKIGLKENSLLQEGGLPLRTLWIAVFLSPRKAHTIFLNTTYKAAKCPQGEKR